MMSICHWDDCSKLSLESHGKGSETKKVVTTVPERTLKKKQDDISCTGFSTT